MLLTQNKGLRKLWGAGKIMRVAKKWLFIYATVNCFKTDLVNAYQQTEKLLYCTFLSLFYMLGFLIFGKRKK